MLQGDIINLILRSLVHKDIPVFKKLSPKILNKDEISLVHYILNDKNIANNYQVIVLNARIIGFFNLFYLNEKKLSLRGFFIDIKYQNKGYASQSLKYLKTYVKKKFPTFIEIELNVDFNNKKAYHSYIKVGFKEEYKKDKNNEIKMQLALF